MLTFYPSLSDPGNITTLPATSETSLIAGAGYLIGSLAGLGGLVAAGIEGLSATAKTALGGLGSVTYTVGSFATAATSFSIAAGSC